MLLRLQRQAPNGAALRGKLFIDGTYFCDTLERVGVQIPALWYTVAVTQSPRFKRLLPIVERVPGRTGIRFHVGTKPSHSSGCILVPSRELENQLVAKLVKLAQPAKHETIYFEVCDFTPEYPLYDVKCPDAECARRNRELD